MSKGPDAEASSDLAAREIAAGGGAAAVGAIGAGDTRFFGHPLGLSNLFFTELFERFSYYGMRALLVLFMTAETVEGGLGYDVAQSTLIYGLYTSLVYLVNLPGGWLADRLLGQRRSVLVGGSIIALGHFTMAIPQILFFYVGLGLIVIGTGLLKPNISVMVGQLYPAEDARRDAGFTIFYMGINMGAFAAPLVCGALAVNYGWHYGFAAAGVGMTVGMIVYVLFGKQIAGLGELTPEAQETTSAASSSLVKGLVGVLVLVGAIYGLMAAGVIASTAEAISGVYTVVLLVIVGGLFGWLFTRDYWTDLERKKLYLIGLLFLGAAVFWAAFEQAGSSLNLFAEQSTNRALPGWLSWIPGLETLAGGVRGIPTAWFQSANAFFIFTIAPIVAALWVSLGRRNADPSSPTKFGIGLILLGLGFVVMVGRRHRGRRRRPGVAVVAGPDLPAPHPGRADAVAGGPERDDQAGPGARVVADDGRVVPGRLGRQLRGRLYRVVLRADGAPVVHGAGGGHRDHRRRPVLLYRRPLQADDGQGRDRLRLGLALAPSISRPAGGSRARLCARRERPPAGRLL